MNQPVIYYKDNQLDKFRTVRSLLSYYIKEWLGRRSLGKVIVMTSVED